MLDVSPEQIEPEKTGAAVTEGGDIFAALKENSAYIFAEENINPTESDNLYAMNILYLSLIHIWEQDMEDRSRVLGRRAIYSAAKLDLLRY